MSEVLENYKNIKKSIPKNITLVAAAKTRSAQEISEVIEAGVADIGENYLQESRVVYRKLADKAKKVKWHMIGHLQTNKVKKAVKIFDIIESVDSLKIAKEINKRCRQIDKIMPILIEINSGKEEQKFGILPSKAPKIIQKISKFKNLKISGLMTMGPRVGDPEEASPYFRKTKKLFDEVKKLNLPGVNMKYLSMGMSNSYKVAIEEGSNMIRVGSAIFGKRDA